MPSFAVRCQATVAVWCALWIGAGCTADGSAGATEDGGAEATTGAMQEAGDAEAGTGDDGGAGGDGCGMDPEEIELTLGVNGQTRAFELHVPADYDPSQAYPLIFGLHGGGGTAASAGDVGVRWSDVEEAASGPAAGLEAGGRASSAAVTAFGQG